MPTSDYHHISDVLHVIQQCNPTNILDVGVGFGKWGTLCREVLEVYNNRFSKDSWTLTIDGIEIHEPYRNELWDFAYNNIHIGNALNIIDSLGYYDVILCCDVIEHLNKEEGCELLNKLLSHGTTVIVTSPRGFAPQGPIYGNEFERHRSEWGPEDFSTYASLYKDIGFTFMAILCSNQQRLRRIDVMHPLRVLGLRKGTRELLRLAVLRAKQKLSGVSA